MGVSKEYSKLCSPAKFYFIVSLIGIIMSIYQNLGSKKIYKIGYLKRKVPNTIFIFMFKVLYVLFWTWVLNLICRDGHSGIAWFLVLIPFMLFFLIIVMLMVNHKLIKK